MDAESLVEPGPMNETLEDAFALEEESNEPQWVPERGTGEGRTVTANRRITGVSDIWDCSSYKTADRREAIGDGKRT